MATDTYYTDGISAVLGGVQIAFVKFDEFTATGTTDTITLPMPDSVVFNSDAPGKAISLTEVVGAMRGSIDTTMTPILVSNTSLTITSAAVGTGCVMFIFFS